MAPLNRTGTRGHGDTVPVPSLAAASANATTGPAASALLEGSRRGQSSQGPGVEPGILSRSLEACVNVWKFYLCPKDPVLMSNDNNDNNDNPLCKGIIVVFTPSASSRKSLSPYVAKMTNTVRANLIYWSTGLASTGWLDLCC